MYIIEEQVSDKLGISRMQLRFILEDSKSNYKFKVVSGNYFLESGELERLGSDIKESQLNFQSVLKELYV